MKKSSERSKQHGKSNPPPRAAVKTSKEAAPARTASPPGQTQVFDHAIARFQAGDFQRALRYFKEVAEGPQVELRHAATMHMRMCEQRLARPAASPKTAEDHYNLAVALINQRQLAPAEEHLRQAIAQSPNGDHLHYALALCRGLSGDLSGAFTSLQQAVTLQPRNRSLARNDPDFAEIGRRPPLADLLRPPKGLDS